MKAVQFDKNNSSKSLVRSCNSDGPLKCCPLPRRFSDAGDPDILAYAFEQDSLFVTFDRRIAYEWTESFAGTFPGVVIVANEDGEIRTMTTKYAGRIFECFKREFPDWHIVSWDNSVVEIRERSILVNHIKQNCVERTGAIDRTSDDWQTQLKALLQTNVNRAKTDSPTA